MISGLVALLIVILVVAIVAAVLTYCIDLLPINDQFKSICKILILLIAVLIIITKALPLLGVGLAATLT